MSRFTCLVFRVPLRQVITVYVLVTGNVSLTTKQQTPKDNHILTFKYLYTI